MNCKCGADMRILTVWDSPNAGYAYNLYECKSLCGMLCKDDVWNNSGLTWIHIDGTIEKEKKNDKTLDDGYNWSPCDF